MEPVAGKQYHRDIVMNYALRKHNKHIADSLKDHGDKVVKKLEHVLSTGTRTGRIYRYNKLPHQASAPGEPPAKMSGLLAESNSFWVKKYRLGIGNKARSKKGAPYPKYLEEGTKKKVGPMKPRPYWISTIESLHDELYKELQNAPVRP